MDTLKREAKITDKDYRLWYKLKKDANISQRMFGLALSSSLNIGCAVEKTFGGKASATMGSMRLNCVVMQDNISKMKEDLN